MTKKERKKLRDLYEKFDLRIRESQAEIIVCLDELRSKLTHFDRLHGEFLGLYRELTGPEKTTKKE
jgi:hypothetical protein